MCFVPGWFHWGWSSWAPHAAGESAARDGSSGRCWWRTINLHQGDLHDPIRSTTRVRTRSCGTLQVSYPLFYFILFIYLLCFFCFLVLLFFVVGLQIFWEVDYQGWFWTTYDSLFCTLSLLSEEVLKAQTNSKFFMIWSYERKRHTWYLALFRLETRVRASSGEPDEMTQQQIIQVRFKFTYYQCSVSEYKSFSTLCVELCLLVVKNYPVWC